MPFQYKTNETNDGIMMNEKGLPIVIDEKGQEIGLDAIHLYSKVPVLQNQVKQHKEAYEKIAPLSELLRGEGLDSDTLPDWLSNAKTALETVKNLDDKSLVDAGTVEKLKKEAQESLRNQFSSVEKSLKAQIDALKSEKEAMLSERTRQIEILHQKEISEQFNGSKFVSEKTALSPLLMKQLFAGNFKIENDEAGNPQIVGYAANGEKIYSKERAGELASFEEAIEILTKSHPDSKHLMLGTAQSGSGAIGSSQFRGGMEKGSLQEMYADAVKRHDVVAQIAIKRQLSSQMNQSQ